MIAQLTIEGHLPCPPLGWLTESWADPAAFFRGLLAGHADALPKRPKSTALERYDFYADLIVRNVLADRPAYRWLDATDGWQTLSFGELDDLCSRRAAEWARHGVQAGETVLVLLAQGPEWVISLLALLKLGAVVSCLPPSGDRFLEKRLALLEPDHIVTDPIYYMLLGAFRDKAIPRGLPSIGKHDGSAVYMCGEPVARLFSPLAPDTHVPIELASDEAYLFALRDGLLVYGLLPGDQHAAPGAHFLQYQPALLFATLLAGATFVHLELEDVKRDPAAFAALKLAAVGVTPGLRDVCRASKLSLKDSWAHWWRGAGEESDFLRWQELVVDCGLTKVTAGNVLVEAARGGSHFFSARRRLRYGGMNMFVLPSAGTAWTLGALGGKGPAPAGGNLGVLCPHTLAGDPTEGAFIIRRQGTEWFFAGVPRPTREGRTYPAGEVLDCVARLDFVEGATGDGAMGGASVVDVATADPARPFAFVLLVFAGRERAAEFAAEADDWRRAIEAAIVRGLAAEHLPDRVELFPLSPRRKEGAVDHAWCRDLYLRGLLQERMKRDIYRLLDDLKAIARESPTEAEPAAAPARPDDGGA